MSAATLTAPVFQSDQRTPLDLPVFQAVSLPYLLPGGGPSINTLLGNTYFGSREYCHGFPNAVKGPESVWSSDKRASRCACICVGIRLGCLLILSQYMLLSKPCSVVREATVKALDVLDQAAGSSSANSRWVFSECEKRRASCHASDTLLQLGSQDRARVISSFRRCNTPFKRNGSACISLEVRALSHSQHLAPHLMPYHLLSDQSRQLIYPLRV